LIALRGGVALAATSGYSQTTVATKKSPARRAKPKTVERTREQELAFTTKREWSAWLQRHHATSKGVLLLIAKKGAARPSVTYAEAVDVALSWGWIDGQKQAKDERYWLQRFSPRTAKSPWSKINRDKATKLIAGGAMAPPGREEVERAKRDGRWSAAYDSARTSSVPRDLAMALEANPRARAFFEAIDGANRYAILYRVQTAKKPETRAERIKRFVEMLAKHETIHPPRKVPRLRVPAQGTSGGIGLVPRR
jgi:uncharacterized protein YdeI (YjbR/CyaY-like superfamily)